MTNKLDAIPGSAGRKIIDGLKDAVAGNFASVTIEGQRWVRDPAPSPQSTADHATIAPHVATAINEIETLALNWNRSHGLADLDDSLRRNWQELRDEVFRLAADNQRLYQQAGYESDDGSPKQVAACSHGDLRSETVTTVSASTPSNDAVREALQLGLDAVNESFEHVVTGDDLLLAQMRHEAISTTLAVPTRSAATSAEPVARDNERFSRLADEPLAVIPPGTVFELSGKSTRELMAERTGATPPSSGNADAVRVAFQKIDACLETIWSSDDRAVEVNGLVEMKSIVRAALSSAPVAGEWKEDPIELCAKVIDTAYAEIRLATYIAPDAFTELARRVRALSRKERDSGVTRS